MSSGATDPAAIVIGFGNPLRGDDGVGWHVAQRVERTLADPRVEIVTCHQLTPELACSLSRVRWAVFIDASVDEAPSAVSRRPLEPAGGAILRDTHELGPAQLLDTARSLFGAAPDGVLYTIGGATFDYSESLSPAVRGSAERLADEIVAELRNLLSGGDRIGKP